MHETIERLSKFWSEHGSLVDGLAGAELEQLRSAPEMDAAYSRLCRDELSIAELSTSTSRGKVSSIYARNRWTAVLIKDYALSDDIVLSPCPAIIIPFRASTTVQVDSYRLDEGQFSRSRIYHAGAVEWIGRETVTFGAAWATPAKGVCANISAIGGESAILLVNGPSYAPYTHSLDSRMEYLNSAFSSDLYNGRVFLSDLIRQAVSAKVQDHCEPAETERLKAFIRATAERPDVVSEEIWPLVQSMSSLDRAGAIDLLGRLGASDHELAPMARSTLLANGVQVDGRENRARV